MAGGVELHQSLMLNAPLGRPRTHLGCCRDVVGVDLVNSDVGFARADRAEPAGGDKPSRASTSGMWTLSYHSLNSASRSGAAGAALHQQDAFGHGCLTFLVLVSLRT